MSKKLSRRQARENAFIILFEQQFQSDLSLEVLMEMAEDNDVLTMDSFSVNLCKSVSENNENIDKILNENLKDWTMDRISKVAKVLLRVAIYEVVFSPDIPEGVAINEAVELAKKYAPENDPAFVNGVLGSVAKKKEEYLKEYVSSN